MRSTTLVVVLCVLAGVVCIARPLHAADGLLQEFPTFRSEVQLVRITAESFPLRGFILGGQVFSFGHCGEYFRSAKTPRGMHLLQLFPPRQGEAGSYSPIFNPRDYRVVYDDWKTVPTEQIVDNGRGGVTIVLRISRTEYGRCSCLRELGIR